MQPRGAWITDIDDTLVESGKMPTPEIIQSLTVMVRALKKQGVLWVPMSGVAMVKMGLRILYNLPEDILDNIIYYAGDGSQKYFYDPGTESWREDEGFVRLFSDGQALAVLGLKEFERQFTELGESGGDQDVGERLAAAAKVVKAYGIDPEPGLLDEMKEVLKSRGFRPEQAETYFRGGSVSWMMLGDIQAAPYREAHAVKVRKELIALAGERLAEKNQLADIGESGIHIPFPGARGIKFVLQGNDKERALRNLIDNRGIPPHKILFVGNELFAGGNDNVVRNIPGITILSVSEGEDPGERVVTGHFRKGDSTVSDVEANSLWMDWAGRRLEQGYCWESLLHTMRLLGSSVIKRRNGYAKVRSGLRGHKQIEAIFFDKGGTLSFRVPHKDGGLSQIKKIMALIGARDSPESFQQTLNKRDKEYKSWALKGWIEGSEEKIWTRFMLPEFPEELVRLHAEELTLLFSHSKGLRRFRPEARGIIEELYCRGYRLGAVTNTVSRVLVPGELEEAGIADFLEVLVMSSLTGIRKPDPRLFLMATRLMKVKPEHSAYIGDQPNRDVEGPRRAGFGMSVVLQNKAVKPVEELDPIQKPDKIIESLEELLILFP